MNARITLRLEIGGGARVFERQLDSWLELEPLTHTALDAHLSAAVQALSHSAKDNAQWKDAEPEEKPGVLPVEFPRWSSTSSAILAPSSSGHDPIVPCDVRSFTGQACNRGKGHHGLHRNEKDGLDFEVPLDDGEA